jgi:quercetin dioxygenase-like cupin family protein
MATRFVTAENMIVDELPWGPHHWLARPGLVDAELLQLVRVLIPPGKGHAFHRHPEFEEIIYVVGGTCEQWVERERRLLQAGDAAHIPMNMVHASYNVGSDTLTLLAILAPAKIKGPPLVDVSQEEPWRSLRP